MKKVITYGTYDLFHEGHKRLLERAKALGDYLIVGVTTDHYDESRGKLNVKQNLMERIENIKATGLADLIIIEEYEGQKINDIKKYQADIFAIGSDWYGKFDYLSEYCQVVYLERTKGISSTELRNEKNGVLRIGVAGAGRIAERFIKESRYVSGLNIEGVYARDPIKGKEFQDKFELDFYTSSYDDLVDRVDAIYVATPHHTHYELSKRAILKNRHVLCEKPAFLKSGQAEEILALAKEKKVIFLEAIKTAFLPGFDRLVAIAKSGSIGEIVNIDATFTKLLPEKKGREFDPENYGGAFTELATYPLLAIAKLKGTSYKEVSIFSYLSDEAGVDLFTKANIYYEGCIATVKVGLGVKSEGDLVISGTKGYIYVPAPWWLTESFEIRYEDQSKNKKFFYKLDGDALRYEIADFLKAISLGEKSYKLLDEEIVFLNKIMDIFINNKSY